MAIQNRRRRRLRHSFRAQNFIFARTEFDIHREHSAA